MMKKICYVWVLLSISSFSNASVRGYVYSLDLSHVKEGKLRVELTPPVMDQEEVIFRIPKIVPGTYEIYDFGRFVSGFKATDADGRELPTEHADVNSWKIEGARRLSHISYLVEASWVSKAGLPIVFEPAGTNIEEGKNFVLNNHGFFGFFDGMKKLNYELNITRPVGFYGSTSLMDVKTHNNTDTYEIPDFMKLVDAPIMYCLPDTTTITIGSARILVSAYSPHKQVTSAFIAKNITEILKAQKEYLGGELPIRKYAFIFYFCEKNTLSGNSGALEHNLSSFYVLPEVKPEYLVQTLRDVAAHEFFHIVTPLSIHSEEIADFDFMIPRMSEHLWLYEGMTEYSAGLVQVKYGIIDLETYTGMLHDKLMMASKFKDTLSFTEMSRHVVEKNYHDQYNNVYEKGALIGMCLDMKLRKLSGGRYGIQEMLRDLSKTYGTEHAFKDDELFDVITKLTYPEIGEFLKKYVAGGAPLPFKEDFDWAGLKYEAKHVSRGISLGYFEMGYDTLYKRIVVAGVSNMTAFGKKMGYKIGDQLIAFNGTDLTLDNANDVLIKFREKAKVGDVLRVDILRKGRRGKFKKKELKANLFEVEFTEANALSALPVSALTDEQKEFRKEWLHQ
jgi:predicted metalloprotease with PDZ domain